MGAAVQPEPHRGDRFADSRLEAAKLFGADVVVNNGVEDAVEVVLGLTGGLGADVAIEAVGVASDVRACDDADPPVRPSPTSGARRAAALHLERALGPTTSRSPAGLVDTVLDTDPATTATVPRWTSPPSPPTTSPSTASSARTRRDSDAADAGALEVIITMS